MDLDWFFKTIRESYPFDFEEIKKYSFYIGCTDYSTGKAVKVKSKDVEELYRLLLASCATPGYYNKRLDFNSTRYVDGALADPVPVKSMLENNRPLVVIRTKPVDFMKPQRLFSDLESVFYCNSSMRDAVRRRNLRFNESIDLIRSNELILDIRPVTLKSSFSRADNDSLEWDYQHGKKIGYDSIPRIMALKCAGVPRPVIVNVDSTSKT